VIEKLPFLDLNWRRNCGTRILVEQERPEFHRVS
jgi:hypothetical protein